MAELNHQEEAAAAFVHAPGLPQPGAVLLASETSQVRRALRSRRSRRGGVA